MTTYVTYQCNLCRRKKDILQDNLRAIPTNCTITKGCLGSLSILGQTNTPKTTVADSQLTDWYPRGTVKTITELTSINVIPLSSSSTGVLTLAIKAAQSVISSHPSVVVKFIQRRVDDISYTLYQFSTTEVSNIVSGRDSNNKILRFNAQAIIDGRISVRVNGVLKEVGIDFTLTPDIITFTSPFVAGTSVEISVYTAKDTVSRELVFTSNTSSSINVNSGAWGNIRWVLDSNDEKWWIYSSEDAISLPTSTRFKLDGVFDSTGTTEIVSDYSNVNFLLSANPYTNTDRYQNLFVNGVDIKEDFYLSTVQSEKNELCIDENMIHEIFPPFSIIKSKVLANSSFVTADILTYTGNITDNIGVKITNTKILGPL